VVRSVPLRASVYCTWPGEATDPLRRYNRYGEITGVTNLGRDGIYERQFRLRLRIAF
jgi:hypothetical protein